MREPLQLLLVEDDLLIADAIENELNRAGFQVGAVAHTAEEAMVFLENNRFDLALIDINLDPLSAGDGVAVAQALLLTQPIPFIYLTGVTISTDPATFERAKMTRPAAFLNKPFRTDELIGQIELAVSNYNPGELPPPPEPEEPVYLPIRNGFSRVGQMEIFYLEAARNFTTVYLTREAAERIMTPNGGQAVVVTGNLSYVNRYLSPRLFYRLDKSLVINLKHIDRVEKEQIWVGGRTVAIKEGARKELLKRLPVIRTR
ncbi:response regulator transcription factor [Rudanella lutea]|uniref:response regulator transcription factor n=1 Tax=Rudanella lutea TaxID=451374 RepID=UPI00039D514A|nr:response regulator [Rudanella lutea]